MIATQLLETKIEWLVMSGQCPICPCLHFLGLYVYKMMIVIQMERMMNDQAVCQHHVNQPTLPTVETNCINETKHECRFPPTTNDKAPDTPSGQLDKVPSIP
jgi:hypothetical protein